MKYLRKFNEEISHGKVNDIVDGLINAKISEKEKELGRKLTSEEIENVCDEVIYNPKVRRISTEISKREDSYWINIRNILKEYYKTGQITDKNGVTKKVTYSELQDIITQMALENEEDAKVKAQADLAAKEASKSDLQKKLESLPELTAYWFLFGTEDGLYSANIKFRKLIESDGKKIAEFIPVTAKKVSEKGDGKKPYRYFSDEHFFTFEITEDGFISDNICKEFVQLAKASDGDGDYVFWWMNSTDPNEKIPAIFVGMDRKSINQLKGVIGLPLNQSIKLNGKKIGVFGDDFEDWEPQYDQIIGKDYAVTDNTKIEEGKSEYSGKIKSFLGFNK